MKRKRYILYRFPSLYGTPKLYRFKSDASIFAILHNIFIEHLVWELKDIKTGKYYPYWR